MDEHEKKERNRLSRYKATIKYEKKTYRRFEFKFRKDTEVEIIEFLKAKESINNYVRNLILEDYSKSSK